MAELGEELDNAVCAVGGEFTVREYKRGPAGTWHDGLLIDLLKEELRKTEGELTDEGRATPRADSQ